jgi:hypothetical protein
MMPCHSMAFLPSAKSVSGTCKLVRRSGLRAAIRWWREVSATGRPDRRAEVGQKWGRRGGAMPRTAGRAGAHDLVTDLTWLRKDQGLTLDRLARAGEVMRACGGRDQPIETIFARFTSALRSMSDIKGGRALWAAYGVDAAEPGLLKTRRSAYAATVGCSSDTIRDWEDQAIHELALRLLSSFYSGSPTPAQMPIPHGGYLLRSLHVVCVNKDRRFVESRQTRTLIPLVDGAPHFTYGTYSPTELSDVANGTLTPAKRTPNGTMHRIEFSPPLTRGVAHTFSFREQVPATEPEPLLNEDFSGQSFETPALRYTVELHFLTDRPAVLWGYDKLARIERPGEPEDGVPVSLDADGRAVVEFSDLYGGLCSGVAWRWT